MLAPKFFGASDMSGWMLAYVSGLGSIWLAVGLVIGAYVNYHIVAPKLRVFTELADNALTIPSSFQSVLPLKKAT
nr:hypothetical protein [Pseudoalteromonas piratica]